jgi:hypothetical protein
LDPTADLQRLPLDQLIPEALVISVSMVLLRVIRDGSAEVPLTQRDDLRQALLLDGPHDQLLDIHRRPGASGLAGLATVVLPGDQRPEPTEQRVRGYNRSDSQERLTADCLGLGRRPRARGIGEVKAFAANVLP